MAESPLKKSTPMRMLERLHPGKSVDQIVRDACRKHETPEGAAAELGVSMTTLRKWRERFGVDEQQPAGVAR
jgi:transposase-like protein